MRKESVLVLKPTKKERLDAADFASKTIAWTFNRMSYNYTKRGQNLRCFNIVKGIIAQEMLKTHLIKHGISVVTDNSYRSSDIFDFLIKRDEKEIKLDLKTNHHYNDYNVKGRPEFSVDYLIQNQNYPGPDWRKFFPMLMPHNQIRQNKDAYCFGISSSVDFRDGIEKDRDGYFLSFFPYDSYVSFISNKKLCKLREENGKGFYLNFKYNSLSLYSTPITIEIVGEWNECYKIERITLTPNKLIKNIGPFSIISSFKIDKNDFENFDDSIEISAGKNEYKDEVLNSSKENINVPPSTDMIFFRKDICNLLLPENYTLYLLGWIYKNDFLNKCLKYPSWVWPKDSVDRFKNQEWSQLTESDIKSISKLGFEDHIKKTPRKFNAGWLKTNGRGGGACCYIFPNIGRNGGVMETNLYVLPTDLEDLNLLFK